jgi:hypothetical protein
MDWGYVTNSLGRAGAGLGLEGVAANSARGLGSSDGEILQRDTRAGKSVLVADGNLVPPKEISYTGGHLDLF